MQPSSSKYSNKTTWLMHLTNAVINPATCLSLEYEDLIKNLFTKRDWGQQIWMANGRPIHPKEIPEGRTATYTKFLCNKRPQKEEENRTQLIMDGNLIS